MNYQTWTPRRFWIVLGIAFFAGVLFAAPMGDTRVDSATDTNVQALSKDAINEVKAQSQERLERLDTLDREIFGLSADVTGAQSKALSVAGTVLGELDTITTQDVLEATAIVNEQNGIIRDATDRLETKLAERDRILAE